MPTPETLLLLRRSREFLAERFDSPVSLSDAAAEIGYSKFHYLRLFQDVYGETPNDFVRRLRLVEAEKLICRHSLSITEAAYQVGYESPTTFSALFAREFGCSPSDHKRVFSASGLWAVKSIPACFLVR